MHIARIRIKFQIVVPAFSCRHHQIEIILKVTFAGACMINPIRPGGGGGLTGPDDQIQSCHSEASYPMMPTFFLLLVLILNTCSENLLAKLINHGSYCCSFLIETSEKF